MPAFEVSDTASCNASSFLKYSAAISAAFRGSFSFSSIGAWSGDFNVLGDAWDGLNEERRDKGLRGVAGDSPVRSDEVEAFLTSAGEDDLWWRLMVLELRRSGLGGVF